MKIEELETYCEKDRVDLDALMHELSTNSGCDGDTLHNAINDQGCHIYVIRDEGRIVASGCLCVAHSTEMRLGFVESICVCSTMRGQRLGRHLIEHIISEARLMGVQKLHLTSHPSRIAANKLYQSLGFELRDTNDYRMVLQHLFK
ncbi:MAG: GNAT family N-acetyltransferase [Bacteroidales bacterium]|nr:GNAT family N-acetyltransferase [Candidatus Cryptobacteroides onthequi]